MERSQARVPGCHGLRHHIRATSALSPSATATPNALARRAETPSKSKVANSNDPCNPAVL